MFHKEWERECKEELVVWREVLPNSYPKGSLWLEIVQCKLQTRIKVDVKEEACREWALRGVL